MEIKEETIRDLGNLVLVAGWSSTGVPLYNSKSCPLQELPEVDLVAQAMKCVCFPRGIWRWHNWKNRAFGKEVCLLYTCRPCIIIIVYLYQSLFISFQAGKHGK
jgi:hypothetical protein